MKPDDTTTADRSNAAGEIPWIRAGRPALVLAPMEGVTDAPMRALMTERGGFTHCVSEFLRVSQDVPPARVFLEHVPELRTGARTPSGVPVQVQLLGGDPERLAQSALRAVQAGAWGIDLNFGCPAPTVNRNDGGATLLKYPERIEAIVRAVRAAVPAGLPVSAKLRLGWDSIEPIVENAVRAADGGASWLTIHARTRMQSYQPPVFWRAIGEARRAVSVPVVANGDIWTIDDFRRCRDESGCEQFMLGRSALADPSLPWMVAREMGLPSPAGQAIDWRERREWLPVLRRFEEISRPFVDHPLYMTKRTKQWVKHAHQRLTLPWWDELKKLERAEDIFEMLCH